ncbi:MAG TPA: immunity 22 family protein [Clostridiaceae bacterium]
MYKEGTVAIWLGYFEPIESLQGYLQVNYSENVDFIDSQFEKDFAIEYFDEEMREIDYFSEIKNSISDILENHSYGDSIIFNYTKMFGVELDRGYNSLILYYNYSYSGLGKEIYIKKNLIKFIGNIDFNTD